MIPVWILACYSPPPPLPSGPPPGTAPAGERVVVFGGVRGDADRLLVAGQAAGLSDATGKWIGGATTIVGMGDMLGGTGADPYDPALADDDATRLFRRWERASAHYGGKSLQVQGAREVEALRAHAVAEDLSLDLSLGPVAYLYAGTLYASAGLEPRWAEIGFDEVNDVVRTYVGADLRYLPTRERSIEALAGASFLDPTDEYSPLRDRTFQTGPPSQGCARLAETLRLVGAARMVISALPGTPSAPRCDGALWMVSGDAPRPALEVYPNGVVIPLGVAPSTPVAPAGGITVR